MGIHNAIKYGADLLRPYSRCLGLGEDEEGAVRVGETITPIVDQWALPEFGHHRGERMAAFSSAVAGVAAEFSAIALINPAGSGLIYIVTTAFQSSTIRCSLRIETQAIVEATLAVVIDPGARDTRGSRIQGDRVLAGSDGAPIGIQLDSRLSEGEFSAVPLVLTPGFAYLIQGATANTQITAGMAYRVKRAQPSEL